MSRLFMFCICLSIGIAGGVLAGGIKKRLRKKEYSDKQKLFYQKCWKTGSYVLTFFTLMILMIGFIWCVYFLVLGAIHPEMADYANNMSELIVSVLTVVSIMFAFYEFVRRK